MRIAACLGLSSTEYTCTYIANQWYVCMYGMTLSVGKGVRAHLRLGTCLCFVPVCACAGGHKQGFV